MSQQHYSFFQRAIKKDTVLPEHKTDIGVMQECLILSTIMWMVIHEIFNCG